MQGTGITKRWAGNRCASQPHSQRKSRVTDFVQAPYHLSSRRRRDAVSIQDVSHVDGDRERSRWCKLPSCRLRLFALTASAACSSCRWRTGLGTTSSSSCSQRGLKTTCSALALRSVQLLLLQRRFFHGQKSAIRRLWPGLWPRQRACPRVLVRFRLVRRFSTLYCCCCEWWWRRAKPSQLTLLSQPHALASSSNTIICLQRWSKYVLKRIIPLASMWHVHIASDGVAE